MSRSARAAVPRSVRRRRVGRLVIVTLIMLAAAVCAVPLLLRIAERLGGICPIRMLTGLSCPGCGTTRAANAVLHGRFADALSYNYLLPLELAWLVRCWAVTARQYLDTGRPGYAPRSPAVDIVFLAVVLLWTVLRNIWGI